ncbi:MAG TPA: hypothetical protein VJ598_06370, partial [Albitalea sp.]|nr:hypothetical protein [Albitalea sp.]
QKERDFETWQEAATWLESKGRRTVSAAEWEEDKHPRDAHGRFAESEGEAQTRLTPSQRERLAGTKVVGPTGAPRMVYHGTTRAFEDFTPEHADPEALFGPGFYFTEDPEVASGYTQGTGELAKARERETTLETENVTLEKTIARMREANDPALPKMEEWLVHNRAELAALQTTERPQVRPAFLAIAHPFDADTDRLTPKQLATLGWPTTGRTDDGEELRGHAGDLLWLVEHQQGVAALFPEALQKLGYDGITHIGGKLTGGQAHRVWIAFRPTQVVSAFSAAAEFDESKHPRDERGRFSETAAETEAVGECFSWANRHAQPGDTIVHATVHHPWDHHAYPHAWIERGDRVLDWQSAEQGLGPGRQGWPKQKFYDAYAPTDRHTYTPDEVRVKMLRTGHHGPWDAAADWDEEKHPRDEHGLWVDTDGAQRDARTGMRVFRTAADVEEFKSWGEQKWKWKDQGNLLRGKPLAYADLPDTLYHATTRLDALAQSDRLKGQHGDAGLGGGIADGVSLTTSRADAQLIVTELTRAHAMVSGDLSAAAVRARLDAYARADERTGHLPPGTLQRGVDAAMQGFEVNLSIAKEHTDPKTGEPEDKSAEWSPGLAYDAFRMYLQCRSTDAQKASGLGYKEFDVSDSPLRNPLLFTNQEVLRTLDPTQFGVIAVPRAAVPSTAVLEPGDDYLHEVRVYGDVSLKSATLHAAADFDESKHPRDEHGRFTDAGGAERTLHVVELPPNAAPWRQYMTAYLFDAQGHGVAQQGAMHQELYEAMRDRHGT